MTTNTTEPVRTQLTVNATPERVFTVFTDGMASWWNPEFTIGGKPYTSITIEPREGGRWYEQDAEGTQCDWGKVLTWDPAERLVLAWQISADWSYDPDLVTELEMHFIATATGPATTRVELEHRRLEVYGEQVEAMRAAFDSPGGWAALLESLAGTLAG